MIRAVWNGAVLAEAATTVQLEGNDYFPAESLRHEFVKESATTTVCPWKGTANYYTVTVDGEVNPDAVGTTRIRVRGPSRSPTTSHSGKGFASRGTTTPLLRLRYLEGVDPAAGV